MSIEKATFIWDTALGSSERVNWLKSNYNKPITEEQYIEHEKALPHDHRKASRCRSTAKAKRRYKHLKERFGFFTDEPRAK